jgi:hypothetical protein
MLDCVDATFNHTIYGSTPMHSLIGVIYDTNLFTKKPLPHPKSTIRIGKEYNSNAKKIKRIYHPFFVRRFKKK